MMQEKHELEEQRQALAEEVVKYRLKIKQLENDLLFRLSNSSVSHACLSLTAILSRLPLLWRFCFLALLLST